jgi:UDP-N-acetylglucosamine--N-acetylmuramyl-(pentapeptide) pyrophosphoryl-undecaprenol N-acetylglucosamine transferase
VEFIDDVARAIGDADIVVARAGAGTVAEITAIGRASLLVPFPHAAQDHQTRNAEALARAGGAVCVRQDSASAEWSERLTRELTRLLEDSAARAAMATAARACGRPNAAERIAVDLLEMAQIGAGVDGGALLAAGRTVRVPLAFPEAT